MPTADWQRQWVPIGDLPSQLGGLVFNQQPGDQQGGDHGLGRLRAVARQAMGVEDLFDAFKQDLDLPAAPIQFQHESHGPALFWQRRHHQVKPREKERLLAQLAAFLSRLTLRLLAQRFGLFVGQDHRDHADGQTLALPEHDRLALIRPWPQPCQPPPDIDPKVGGSSRSLTGIHRQVPRTEAREGKGSRRIDGQQLGSLAVRFIADQDIAWVEGEVRKAFSQPFGH